MRRAELIAAALFAAMGILFWVEAGSLPAGQGEVGPAYFPRIVSALLLILTVALVIDVLRRKDDRRPFPIEAGSAPRILAALALTAVYPWALDWLGYLVATFIYGTCLFLSLKVRWYWAVAAGAAAAVAIWASFQLGLQVPLPQGALF